jgi:hypothetical protein
MTRTSTERKLSRSQIARHPKVDQAIYLRTYDVINALDRAEHIPWWHKALENVRRLPLSSPVSEVKAALNGAAPMKALAAAAETETTLARQAQHAGLPVLARRRIETEHKDLAFGASSGAHSNPLLRAVPDTRPISWVLLAVVAVITAGLTFVIIHFGWPSLSAGTGGQRPKHAATYITTRSQVSPRRSVS